MPVAGVTFTPSGSPQLEQAQQQGGKGAWTAVSGKGGEKKRRGKLFAREGLTDRGPRLRWIPLRGFENLRNREGRMV